MVRKYANNYSSTLNGAITNVQTTITVTSATGLPSIGAGETYRLTIDDGTNIEVVEVTDDTSSPTLTVTRGVDGTSGTAFADGDTVELRATAASFTDVLAADETPALVGPLDASDSNAYIGFGGSSSSTAYCLNHTANVPRLIGPANYYWGFSGTTKLYAQAGTTFNKIEFANDSNRFRIWTNNSERFQVNDSGVNISNGNLELNAGNMIIDSTYGILDENSNEQLMFTTTASAVNHIKITNAATATAPVISSTGLNTNVDLKFGTQGTGNYVFPTTASNKVEIPSSTVALTTFLGGDDIAIRNNITSGGWARGLMIFENTSGTDYFSMGAYGSGQTYTYGYIGTSYLGAAIKFDSSNNVGIGLSSTTSPSAQLDVNGAIHADSISFDSGTNTLADYEEGTFTPVLADAATGGNTATASTTIGRYTRIGRQVIYNVVLINVDTTGMTGANQLFLRSLPFTSANPSANNAVPSTFLAQSTTSTTGSLGALSQPNTAYTQLYNQTTTGLTILTVSSLTSGAADLYFNGYYEV